MQSTDFKGKLPLAARGKVRELYELPGDKFLFIATDRISAYDVILNNGIPGKGQVLTSLSRFWFSFLKDIVQNHVADDGDPLKFVPENVRDDPYLTEQIKGRSMVVNKYKILPLEVIVRGYITGSAWSEYSKTGTVHGKAFPPGLKESEAFPTPLFTPSTKAEFGQHDENISKEKAAEILGSEELISKIEDVALKLYTTARDYALTRGIIIADTKFEFGVDADGKLVLVDEVLTPDSSRFWPKDGYEIGKTQDSFDKQYLRNWLTANNLRGKEGVTIPDSVAAKTAEKYADVAKRLIKV